MSNRYDIKSLLRTGAPLLSLLSLLLFFSLLLFYFVLMFLGLVKFLNFNQIIIHSARTVRGQQPVLPVNAAGELPFWERLFNSPKSFLIKFKEAEP
jgi:hypothetical protein